MTTWYINADTGNDTTGDGSSGSPWKTISKAHGAASGGDTVVCQDSVAAYTFASQTFTKSLTIQGEQDDASGAVFDGALAAVRWQVNSNVDLVVSKITIENVKQYCLIGPSQNADNGSNICTNVVFKNIQVPSGNNLGVIGNINNSGSNPWTQRFAGCLFDSMSATVVGSAFIGANLDNDSHDIELVDCTVYMTDVGGQYFANVLETQFGQAQPSDLDIKNCIFYAGASMGWGSWSGGGTTTVTYTCFHNVSGSPAQTGNITSDPLFVDAANGDFRLRSSSPCINSGTLL